VPGEEGPQVLQVKCPNSRGGPSRTDSLPSPTRKRGAACGARGNDEANTGRQAQQWYAAGLNR
jgi:hypothetical protein